MRFYFVQTAHNTINWCFSNVFSVQGLCLMKNVKFVLEICILFLCFFRGFAAELTAGVNFSAMNKVFHTRLFCSEVVLFVLWQKSQFSARIHAWLHRGLGAVTDQHVFWKGLEICLKKPPSSCVVNVMLFFKSVALSVGWTRAPAGTLEHISFYALSCTALPCCQFLFPSNVRCIREKSLDARAARPFFCVILRVKNSETFVWTDFSLKAMLICVPLLLAQSRAEEESNSKSSTVIRNKT